MSNAFRRNVLALAFFSLLSAPSFAGDATSSIQGLYQSLLGVMQQAKELGVKGRYDQLAPVLGKTYDLAGMAKTSVGPAWDTLQPAQQAAIVEAFQRMVIATYAARFDGYSGEKFEIQPAVDQAPGKLVKTQIVQSNGKTVPLNYLMRAEGGDWVVVDVYLQGTISELATRRAEFSTIIKSGGADALIASLKQQGDKLLAGG